MNMAKLILSAFFLFTIAAILLGTTEAGNKKLYEALCGENASKMADGFKCDAEHLDKDEKKKAAYGKCIPDKKGKAAFCHLKEESLAKKKDIRTCLQKEGLLKPETDEEKQACKQYKVTRIFFNSFFLFLLLFFS